MSGGAGALPDIPPEEGRLTGFCDRYKFGMELSEPGL